jgi:hypothetical protein
MRKWIIVWPVILFLSLFLFVVVYQRAFDYDAAQLSPLSNLYTLLLGLPLVEQLLAIFFGLSIVWLTVWVILQADKASKRDKELKQLHDQLAGLRLTVTMSAEQQKKAELATEAISKVDPEAMVMSLQKRVAATERQVKLQKDHTDPEDLPHRIKDIQDRQSRMGEEIGKLVEKRRASVPLFRDLSQRQQQVEAALAELESIDGGKSLADQLAELVKTNANAAARTEAVKDAFVTLNRLQSELNDYTNALAPLRDEAGGIAAITNMTRAAQTELNRALDQIELGEDERLSLRAERLLRDKLEVERRMGAIAELVATVKEVRQDVVGLDRKRRTIEQSLAAAEVDDLGRPVAEHLREFTDYAIKAQRRLHALQDMQRQLKELETAVTNSQAALEPLARDGSGIKSVLVSTSALRDELAKSLDALEGDGETSLSGRVGELLRSKREAELRIEALKAAFASLASIQTDIGSLLTSVMDSLGTHAPSHLDRNDPAAPSAAGAPENASVTEEPVRDEGRRKTTWARIFGANGFPWQHGETKKESRVVGAISDRQSGLGAGLKA